MTTQALIEILEKDHPDNDLIIYDENEYEYYCFDVDCKNKTANIKVDLCVEDIFRKTVGQALEELYILKENKIILSSSVAYKHHMSIICDNDELYMVA